MPDDPPIHLTAREARGGTIILRTRRRRLIFIAGLAALALVAVAAWFAG